MSDRRLTNNAVGIRDIWTLTIASTWLATETVTVTIGGTSVVITIGSLVTTAQVATTIQQALAASGINANTFTDTTATVSPPDGGQSIPQFTELTAAVAASVVTLTAKTIGKPIVVTASTTSASGTVTVANAIVATGPLFFGNTGNWTAATVPVNNDTITIDSGNQGILYGLTTSIQPLVYNQTLGFTGKIGLAQINKDSAQNLYSEYRTPVYLTFTNNSAICVYTIGEGLGGGSQRTKIDAGAGEGKFLVIATGTRELPNVPALLIKGTNSGNVLTNQNGDVGIAFYDGETATFATINQGSGVNSGARLVCGAGVTLTGATINMTGGLLETNSAVDIGLVYGGQWTHQAGNVTTLNIYAGSVIWKADSGTITTLTIGDKGTFDHSQDARPVTITNAVLMYKGAVLRDPYKTITFSAGIQLVDCTIDDVTIDVGPNRTLSVA